MLASGSMCTRVALLFILMMLCGAQTQGGVIVFTGKDIGASMGSSRPNSAAAAANFKFALAELGTPTLVDFELAPLGAFNNLLLAPGVTIDGVDGTSGSDQKVLDHPFNPTDKWYGYNTSPGGLKFVGLSGGNITFTFAEGVQAFGGYLTGLQNFGGTRNFSFNDGTPRLLEIPGPGGDGGAVFFGFTDTGMTITSVTINVPGDYVSIDDILFVKAPEPSSALAAAIAVGVVSLRRRSASCLARR